MNSKRYAKDFGIIAVFIILVVALTLLSDGYSFIQVGNLTNILKQTTINGILSMGMMFVILSGGIDLSVGSIIALTGVVSAMLAHPGEYPLIIPILIPVVIGAMLGLFNGVFVTYGGIPAFIVTLGSMSIFRGLALIVSGGSPVSNLSDNFRLISTKILFGIPILALYFIVIVFICSFILYKTVIGRRIYAIGGNEISARVSGINVNRVKLFVYSVSGLLAGICGMLLASRTTTGSPTSGEGYELDAIAATVIGGVSMTGGAGNPIGVVIGALMIAVIANGLDILRIDSNYQKLVKGAIIIIAVLLDVKTKKQKN